MPRGGSRPGAGRPRKAATASAKPRKTKAQAPEIACEVLDAIPTSTGPVQATDEPVINAETPLDLLLSVVKCTGLRLAVRMQAASLAAPFCHAKPAPAGKKEAKADAAKGAGSGKFAASAAPLRVVTR